MIRLRGIQLNDAVQPTGKTGMRTFIRTYGDGAVKLIEYDEGMIVRCTDAFGNVTIIPWTQVRSAEPEANEPDVKPAKVK